MLKLHLTSLKRLLYLLAYKKVDIMKLVEEVVEKKQSEISYFSLSSNSIKIFDHNGEKCFFRECRKHEEFKDYLQKVFSEFYRAAACPSSFVNFDQKIPIKTCFSMKEIADFREYVETCSRKPHFFEKIKCVKIYLKEVGFNIWTENVSVPIEMFERMGFSQCPESMHDIFVYFLCFISTTVENYFFYDFITLGDYETFAACRSVATYKLAQKLGVERLVSPAKIVRLVVDNEDFYGVLCPQAGGKRAFDCDYGITPSLHRELTNLNILDAICLQPDHWVNNYNVIADAKGLASSVCAFDNDCNWTFFPWWSPSFKSICDGASIIDKNGGINLSYVDASFAENILNVNVRALIRDVNPFLNRLQLWALKKRLEKIQGLIRDKYMRDKSFFVSAKDWNLFMAEEELQGNKGRTYLMQYMKKEETEMHKKCGCQYKQIKFV